MKGSLKKVCSISEKHDQQQMYYAWWKQHSCHEDYRFLVYKPIFLHQQDSKCSYIRANFLRTKLKGKQFNLSMTIGKGSSLLCVICLKIISSLLKIIFQNNILFQRCFKKIFQRSNHWSNRYWNICSCSWMGWGRGGGGQKGPPPENLLRIFYNDETWHSYTLPKENSKNIWITWHTLLVLVTS